MFLKQTYIPHTKKVGAFKPPKSYLPCPRLDLSLCFLTSNMKLTPIGVMQEGPQTVWDPLATCHISSVNDIPLDKNCEVMAKYHD